MCIRDRNISTSGSGLSYQWRKNGVLISGATDSVYIIKSVKLNDAGKYDVIVGNGCGSSVTSNIANIITGNAKVDAPSLMDFGKVSIDLKYRDVDVIVKNSNIEAIKFERIESLTEPFSVVLVSPQIPTMIAPNQILFCLLYTSDAADERSSVDLGGRRSIKKKKQNNQNQRHNIHTVTKKTKHIR